MGRFTAFGLFAVTTMLLAYALEICSRWSRSHAPEPPARRDLRLYFRAPGRSNLVEAIWAKAALYKWRGRLVARTDLPLARPTRRP